MCKPTTGDGEIVNSLHPEHDLLQAYLERTLDADAVLALEARLSREPELAQALVFLAREEAIGKEWASSAAIVELETKHPQPRPRMRIARRVAVFFAFAACLVMLLFLGGRRGHNEAPDSLTALATLEDIQGLVEIISPEGQVHPAQVGQQLFAGHEIRTGEGGSGTTVRCPHDSRLVLGSETRIRLDSEKTTAKGSSTHVFVAEGVVSADVPQRPNGTALVLYSPLAELHGNAGHYSFASLPEGTFVETDAGHGRFIRKTDGSVIDVASGQFAVASISNEPFKPRSVPTRLSTPRRTIIDGTGPVLGLFFDLEGLSITSFTSDGARRWSLSSGKPVWNVHGATNVRPPPIKPRSQKDPLRPASMAQNGRVFALVPEERFVKLYDGYTGSEKSLIQGSKKITAICLSPDGLTLAVTRSNLKDAPEIRLYDTLFGLERTIISGQTGTVQCLTFSPKGDFLATASTDRSVKIWQMHDLSPVRTLSKSSQEPRALAFSPDERFLAIAERKGTVRLVDPHSGTERYLLNGHLRDVWSLAFSPDGRYLLTGGADNTARLWKLEDGQEVTTLKLPQMVTAVAFSQDGRMIATGTWDKKILLWDMPPIERP
jgi:dipeptidyl aminopeptidase/acylaminoacyl peptidase